MKIILESQRLVFRCFTEKDATLIFDLNNDPAVTRFAYNTVNTAEGAKQILEKSILPQYKLYGFGRWAVHIKETMEFAGYCGLKYRAEREETDLGYRFRKSCWGMGYATEAAIACTNYGLSVLAIPRIVARVDPANQASVRVLEKSGFGYMGEDQLYGFKVLIYEILAREFKSGQGPDK